MIYEKMMVSILVLVMTASLFAFAAIIFIDVPKSVASKVKNINVEIEYWPWDGMCYKPVIYLYSEQKLTTPDRTGFVAVEWGGTQII